MSKDILKVGLVQEKWSENPNEHQDRLASGIFAAAKQGAQIVCLQELTLSPYFCTRHDVDPTPYMEDIATGPTARFVSAMAKSAGVTITASLFEKAGYNTAVAFDESGTLIASTRKQHIPSGEKYHEDYYFKPGDSDYPVHTLAGHRFGLPTCYDQWFPELSRIYGLKETEVLVYPTAIGGEPTAPGFDSQPMWQKVMVAQGIMANTFIVAVNRIGCEDGLEFYGSSFISNPMGEILAQAPRNEPAVLVAELDFSQRALWGRLFPFAMQREPETYQELLKPRKSNLGRL
ncbi:carbon-nitrogen hydrolase [Legionella micdadei]|uniref:N-carbamoylputrescine amidase n=1 Tax=Legionella micdadei TaxID=451 RepID=A0A098GFK9_LEGMI|nr:carbon-nitrogen hydrolase [Legionella micdadei]ARG98086.1 hydrolase [Legionella micdadei]KTD30081.1 putative hydrolase [Legionella micdadei]NSL18544.1 carbon-nitrogen hydrolase [Legionella micdadei]CEG60276.1 N-carbamoylputrescine amidase [Legionella micdadei]SCY57273.1 N-carbamoylputrescine amidase [Legionella micdadei]